MADTSYESAKALDDAYVMHTYGRLPVEFVSGSGPRSPIPPARPTLTAWAASAR